jgi:hypothetical protein
MTACPNAWKRLLLQLIEQTPGDLLQRCLTACFRSEEDLSLSVAPTCDEDIEVLCRAADANESIHTRLIGNERIIAFALHNVDRPWFFVAVTSLAMHKTPYFVRHGGVSLATERLYESIVSPVPGDDDPFQILGGLRILEEVVRETPHAEYVLYDSHLHALLGVIVGYEHPTGLIDALVTACGTAFLMHMKREMTHEQFTVFLFKLVRCADYTSRQTTRLLDLWPRVVADAIRYCYIQGPPITSYECPITFDPCVDPVVASDGHTYERDAILTHLSMAGTSPLTRGPLDTFVVSNMDVAMVRPYCPTGNEAAPCVPSRTSSTPSTLLAEEDSFPSG